MTKALIDKLKKTLDNSGVAMIYALVITVILLILGTMCLSAAFAIKSTISRRMIAEQCHELALSFSLSLDDEITANVYPETPDKKEDEVTNFLNYLKATGSDSVASKYPLWLYLRCNVLQESWPYYAPEEGFVHDKDYTHRVFDLSASNPDSLEGYETKVTMYWSAVYDEIYGDGTDKDFLRPNIDASPELYVVVTTTKGEISSTVTAAYYLLINDYDDKNEKDGKYNLITDEQKRYKVSASGLNPDGNSIYPHENWQFVLDYRK